MESRGTGREEAERKSQVVRRQKQRPPGLLFPSSASSPASRGHTQPYEMLWADPAALPPRPGHNVIQFNKHLQMSSFVYKERQPQALGTCREMGRQVLTEKTVRGSRELSPELCGRPGYCGGS